MPLESKVPFVTSLRFWGSEVREWPSCMTLCSLIRLQVRWEWELQSFEGLTGAGGSSSKMTLVHDYGWGLSSSLLAGDGSSSPHRSIGTLASWQLASPRADDPREREEVAVPFMIQFLKSHTVTSTSSHSLEASHYQVQPTAKGRAIRLHVLKGRVSNNLRTGSGFKPTFPLKHI